MLARSLGELGVPVVVLSRTMPHRTLRAWRRVAWRPSLGLGFVSRDQLAPNVTHIEYPAPAGPLEQWQLRQAIRSTDTDVRAVVVSDPRSASIFTGPVPGLKVFDAYDAWDLSPLYRERPRIIEAIRRGYEIAARHADLIVANTPYMADRLSTLGAQRVELLPNGGPQPRSVSPGGGGVVYLGNIQRRLRIDLMTEAARVAVRHGSGVMIVGAMQDEPGEWAGLLAQPGVDYLGARHGDQLEAAMAGASVGVIPHRVDDYTQSQDAMKAWEYLARGMAIVSTSVPPATIIPAMATIADDPASFGAGVRDAILGDGMADDDRLQLAKANTWTHRAEGLLGLLS